MIPDEIKKIADDLVRACKEEKIDFIVCLGKYKEASPASFYSKMSVENNHHMLDLIHETIGNWSLMNH